MPATPVTARATRLLVIALLALTLTACQHGAPPATQADTPTGQAADGSDKGSGKCYQGCVTWGESCNVDPRGVYKCQRRCERFGEVCE